MTRDEDLEVAGGFMLRFAERTGLSSGAAPRRYLWTDAFAVCNFLGLARATGERRYRDLALQLVDQVHQVLGRYRPGSPRAGWLSGLGEAEGAAHPTRGGLRIGKRLPERAPGEPFDEGLEWDRDGQYFHYLTRWMHALDQTARATGQVRFNLWARELAETAHRAFSYGGPGNRRMVWKMSVDLARPLVPSMGQHDPLDGLVTAWQVGATAAALGAGESELAMTDIVADFAEMLGGHDLATADPLGLGGLLTDAARAAQLGIRVEAAGGELLEILLASALLGLPLYQRSGDLRRPAERRLAFRELGLSIGLRALEPARAAWERTGGADAVGRKLLDALAEHRPLGEAIEAFWRDPAHRQVPSWLDHRDINDVMLATSLAPEGFVTVWPVS